MPLPAIDFGQYRERLEPAVAWYQAHRKWFALGKQALEAIYYARTGGPVATTAACISVGASVAEVLFPETTLDDKLEARGYQPLATSTGRILCALLQGATPTEEIAEPYATAKLWERRGAGVAAIFTTVDNRYVSGPFLLGGDDGVLVDALSRAVWRHGSDLMLTARGGGRDLEVSLVPLPAPGPFIGDPSPRALYERLQRCGAGPRTLLIKGPSGVGKSVLARHVASYAAHGAGRTLRVSAAMARGFGAGELRDLARYLSPSVILLDDLPYDTDRRHALEDLLDLLETLRVESCFVIITKMEEEANPRAPRRGDNYIEGMRPGRIDEIVTLPSPDAATRKKILEHYYRLYGTSPGRDVQRLVVQQTQGLTGAYLAEVARRIVIYGSHCAQAEIDSVLMAAPTRPRRRRIAHGARLGKPTAAMIRRRLERLERLKNGGIQRQIETEKKHLAETAAREKRAQERAQRRKAK